MSEAADKREGARKAEWQRRWNEQKARQLNRGPCVALILDCDCNVCISNDVEKAMRSWAPEPEAGMTTADKMTDCNHEWICGLDQQQCMEDCRGKHNTQHLICRKCGAYKSHLTTATCKDCGGTINFRDAHLCRAHLPINHEQYVRERWEDITVYTEGGLLIVLRSDPDARFFLNWSTAHAYTKAHEQQIAEVEAEISLLKGWRFVQENNPAALRIFARECAALADLQRVMKVPE